MAGRRTRTMVPPRTDGPERGLERRIAVASRFSVIAGGHRGGQPRPRALQPLVADRGQLLPAFPQLKGLLQGEAPGLELLHHADELVPGLLVREGVTVC